MSNSTWDFVIGTALAAAVLVQALLVSKRVVCALAALAAWLLVAVPVTVSITRSVKPGAVVEFPLAFGASPRATVVYTQSYEHFGVAELSIGSSQASLDAYYAVRATVSRVLVINAQQGAETVEGLRGFDVRPFTNRTLRVAFRGGCRSARLCT